MTDVTEVLLDIQKEIGSLKTSVAYNKELMIYIFLFVVGKKSYKKFKKK